MIFTLIVATYGRTDEIPRLLESLQSQTFNKDLFEIVFIDQNEHDELEAIFKPFTDLNIVHIKSKIKGISVNRNIGIDIAKGKYLAFPDDDCIYYPDTLGTALFYLESLDSPMILGAIYDREIQKPIIKKWPRTRSRVSLWNLQRFSTSINIFCRNNKLRFHEDLGVGTKHGSCEDLEFIYKYINIFGNAIYIPSIEVWHPDPDISNIPLSKVEAYGRGFGKFCKIYRSHAPVLLMLFMTLSYHAIQLVKETILMHPSSANKRLKAITSRIRSFFN